MTSIAFAVISFLQFTHAAHLGAFSDARWRADAQDAIPEPNTSMAVIIALNLQTSESELREILWNVSDPKSAGYGSYLSTESLRNLSAPTEKDYLAVRQWAEAPFGSGVAINHDASVVERQLHAMNTSSPAEHVSESRNEACSNISVSSNVNRDILRLQLTVQCADAMFNTTIRWHTENKTSSVQKRKSYRYLRAVQELQVPNNISPLLSFVSLNVPIHPKKKVESHGDVELQAGDDSSLASLVANASKWPTSTLKIVAISPDGLTLGVRLRFADLYCQNYACISPVVEFAQFAVGSMKRTPFLVPPVIARCHAIQNASTNQNKHENHRKKNQTQANHTKQSVLQTCVNLTANDSCVCAGVFTGLPRYVPLHPALVLSGLLSDRENRTHSVQRAFGLSNGSAPVHLADMAHVDLLRELYNIPRGVRATHPNATQAVAEFYGEFWSAQDLQAFQKLSGLPGENVSFTPLGDLPNNQSSPGGEAQLDVEYMLAISPGAKTSFYSIVERNPHSLENEGFLSWLFFLGCEEDPPFVHSLSYGDLESSVFNSSRAGASEYAARIDLEFLKLGLRGRTVLVASGDDGVAGFEARPKEKEQKSSSTHCLRAEPEWPASSPYVTTVGATMLSDAHLPLCATQLKNGLPTSCRSAGEVVCSSDRGGVITSGAGFSNVYSRRAVAHWQSPYVDEYLTRYPEALPHNRSFFEAGGRAYPDIAAYGSNYFVVLSGHHVLESGTSASTPVVAAMTTLWNDARFSKGLPAMGFLAPALYHVASLYPDSFQDVVVGDTGCVAWSAVRGISPKPKCCNDSFKAAPGWDAASGLGTPNFLKLKEVFVHLAEQHIKAPQCPNLEGSHYQLNECACAPDVPKNWTNMKNNISFNETSNKTVDERALKDPATSMLWIVMLFVPFLVVGLCRFISNKCKRHSQALSGRERASLVQDVHLDHDLAAFQEMSSFQMGQRQQRARY